ncbi:MAG: dTDP-4-dehydrorhamnose reductase [Chloroflexota bacterium]
MRILLLGNTGQLGWELERTLAPLGEVIATDYPALNLAEADGTRALVRGAGRVDVIVNATAHTLVDKAENEPDKSLSWAINASGPGLLAEEARALGAALIHYSTDYVFDGAKGSPYVETDATNPLNVYGHSKLAGEQAVAAAGGAYLTLRTTWVYSTRRSSFVTKVLEWARQQTTLKVVADQISGPTSARMLAEITAQLLAKAGSDPAGWIGERRGLYHLAGDGYCSRLEWAQEVLHLDPKKQEQTVREILPALTNDFPTPAARPLFSALDCAKFTQTFCLKLPAWQSALRLAMES